jgi:hypothetical protein
MFRPEYKPKLTALVKAADPVTKEWTFNFDEILSSPRKVKGKFHTPMIDKDNEYVQGEAVRNAVPDFMHLPILHDFHKERTVGIVTRVVELSDGSFDFEGLIKATDDCNDVWELIEKGNYDQVSIYGKRTCGSDSCSMRPEARKEPCVTTAVRLDSISVCDEKARNEGTSLYVAKGAKVVFNANEELIKAETTDSSLMHTVTDKPKKGYKINSKGEVIRTDTPSRATCPQYERQELGKGEDMNDEMKGKIEIPGRGIPKKGKFDSVGRNAKKPEEKEKAPESSWAGESRKADEVESADVEGEVEESVEEKIDKLEMIIEGLVQKDKEAKASKPDPYANYSDKSPEIQPSDVDQGEPLEPEAEREYGAPEEGEGREVEVQPVSPSPDGYDDVDKLAAHIHLTSKVGTGSEEKAGVPKISLTDRKTTSPEEVEHWKKQYDAGKGEYQAQEAAKIAERESMKQTPKVDPNEQLMENQKKLNPDVARVDIKAGDDEDEPEYDPKKPKKDWSPKDIKDVQYEGSKHEGIPKIDPKKPWAEEETAERQKKLKAMKDKQPPAPKDKGGKKLGSEEEAKENVAKIPPSQVKDTESKDVKVHASVKDREMNKEPGGGRSFRQIEPDESPDVRSKPGETRPLATGTKPGAPEHRKTPPPPEPKGEKYKEFFANDSAKQFKEEKAGEMPDINSRLDRLIAIVAQLVQSDEGVHEQMDNPINEEEKAISKGTETMKDEEVDLLVKAKVDAKVEEISKAYIEKVEELKKANTELEARIAKMENETIEKSGVAVILRDGDGELGTVLQSNAAAISAISKAQKSKV